MSVQHVRIELLDRTLNEELVNVFVLGALDCKQAKIGLFCSTFRLLLVKVVGAWQAVFIAPNGS